LAEPKKGNMTTVTPEEKPKKPSKFPRARASRLLKRAAKKLAEIPDEFLDRALHRLGEQLDATKPMWSVEEKRMIYLPDEKIRQDAAIMILAYRWGKPVERSITGHADMDDFEKALEIARDVQQRRSLQKTVEGK